MIIDRNNASYISRTLARADDLKAKVDNMAAQVAELDGKGIDGDPAADKISIENTVPRATAAGRLFSRTPAMTAEVSLNPRNKAVEQASVETDMGFLRRGRYELQTGDDGSQTYSLTELHPIGEELLDSYTFSSNGTITVHHQDGRAVR